MWNFSKKRASDHQGWQWNSRQHDQHLPSFIMQSKRWLPKECHDNFRHTNELKNMLKIIHKWMSTHFDHEIRLSFWCHDDWRRFFFFGYDFLVFSSFNNSWQHLLGLDVHFLCSMTRGFISLFFTKDRHLCRHFLRRDTFSIHFLACDTYSCWILTLIQWFILCFVNDNILD